MTPENFEVDWLAKWSSYAPNTIALVDGENGARWSYADFASRAKRYAEVLRVDFGIGAGDRVAVLASNSLEYFGLFFGLQRLGAILVPVNIRFTSREVEHICADARPKVLFVEKEFAPVAQGVAGEVKPLLGDLEELTRRATDAVEFQSFVGQFEDPCMILYTSGTTGFPKGATLTHKTLFWNSINTTLRLNISQTDSTVTFLPLFHTGGWNVLTTPFLHRGAKVVLLKKFDAEKILTKINSENLSLLFGVPTTMEMLARHPLFAQTDFSKIRYAIVGGEPMPLGLITQWESKGVRIRQGYGLTEFGPNVFSLNESDSLRKIGSIGFPNFYCEAKIVDSDGQELGDDRIGELVLRGPMAMQGYWNHPEATKEVFRNGWLHTGDLVRRDAEGFYYVVGRKKDMFISGGENVYPSEVEQVIHSIDGVREVAVIGIKDERWGEVGKAFIALDPSVKVSSQEIMDHCQKNLAKFKIPKNIEFRSTLPKTDSGKILKSQLL